MDLNCLSVSGIQAPRGPTMVSAMIEKPHENPTGVVEEHEHVIEHVDQRLDGVGDREDVHLVSASRGRRNRRWASHGIKAAVAERVAAQQPATPPSTSPRSMP